MGGRLRSNGFSLGVTDLIRLSCYIMDYLSPEATCLLACFEPADLHMPAKAEALSHEPTNGAAGPELVDSPLGHGSSATGWAWGWQSPPLRGPMGSRGGGPACSFLCFSLSTLSHWGERVNVCSARMPIGSSGLLPPTLQLRQMVTQRLLRHLLGAGGCRTGAAGLEILTLPPTAH